MNSFQAQETTPHDLVLDTVQVINETLHDERDDVVQRRLLPVMDKLTDGGDIGVEVFEENPLEPEACFTVQFQEEQVQAYERGQGRSGVVLRVSKDHLADVCNDPARFRSNPMSIDLIWLKSRVAA